MDNRTLKEAAELRAEFAAAQHKGKALILPDGPYLAPTCDDCRKQPLTCQDLYKPGNVNGVCVVEARMAEEDALVEEDAARRDAGVSYTVDLVEKSGLAASQVKAFWGVPSEGKDGVVAGELPSAVDVASGHVAGLVDALDEPRPVSEKEPAADDGNNSSYALGLPDGSAVILRNGETRRIMRAQAEADGLLLVDRAKAEAEVRSIDALAAMHAFYGLFAAVAVSLHELLGLEGE